MKKVILLFIFSAIILACGSVKKTQKALNTGNYDNAITTAIENLQNNKTKKK